jgi:hypothetical protein
MSSEFIHDPEGIVLFEEPTSVEASSGGASSTTTVRVLPFSARRDENVFWAGYDTYHVPEDAEFTVLEDLDLTDSDIDIDAEEEDALSLASLLAEE